jgi:hypothetical protein
MHALSTHLILLEDIPQIITQTTFVRLDGGLTSVTLLSITVSGLVISYTSVRKFLIVWMFKTQNHLLLQTGEKKPPRNCLNAVSNQVLIGVFFLVCVVSCSIGFAACWGAELTRLDTVAA